MSFKHILRHNSGHNRKRLTSRALQLAVAALSLQAARSALALTDTYTTNTSGLNWNVAASWTTSASTHVVPVAGDDVILGSSSAISLFFNMSYGSALNSLTINDVPASFTLTQNVSSAMFATTETIGTTTFNNTYIQSAGTNTTTTLNLGVTSNSASQGAYQLSATGALSATTENIGNSGQFLGGGNLFAQSGGTNNAGSIIIGSIATSIGCYTLSSGIATVSGNVIIGNSGTGTLAQSGGTLTSGNLTLGNTSTGSGTLSLGPTAILNTGYLVVGNVGVGAVSQTGGNLTVTTGITVGLGNTTSVSSYTMSGGNLNLNSSSPLEIGYGGSGCMSQSAGAITFNGGGPNNSLILGGNTAASTGTYTLSGTGTMSGAVVEAIADTGNATFTQNAGNNTLASAGTLYLGGQATATGFYNLNSGNLAVSSGTEIIAAFGNGTFTQMGGSNFINFSGASGTGLFVGLNANSHGCYSLQNGTLTTTFESETIGDKGNGNFTQSGGTNSVSDASTSGQLILGNSSGGNGTYTLTGPGVLTCGGNELIGNAGNGTFTQVSGDNTLTGAGSLEVGNSPTGCGTYNLQSGNLTIAGGEEISNSGTGNFNQSGGTQNIGLGLVLGSLGSGTYTLSNGTLNCTSIEYIGYFISNSTFTQSGASINNVGNELDIARFNTASGLYVLDSGTLNVLNGFNEIVGDDGAGGFQQYGGFNIVTGSLILGFDSGSLQDGSGTYTLNNGTLTVTNGESIGPNEVGSFTQSGGINNANGTGLTIGTIPGDIYTLSGGTLNTSALNVNGTPANFHWTGGTLNLTTAVTFDPSAGPTTTSAAFGPSLTLNAGMNLGVSGIETLGGASAFTLTVNTGSSDTAPFINVATTGTLIQNGGALTGAVTNAGIFLYNGGAITGSLSNFGTASFSVSATIPNGMSNAGIVTTLALGTTLTVNGSGLTNTGSIAIAGGTINASVISNSGLISGYGGFQGSPFSNSGVITQVGGNIFINSLTTGFNNSGTINLASGLQIQISGLPVTNDGFIALNGGNLSTGPGLTNAIDGTINGPGKIFGIFTNNGTLAVPAGNTNGNFGFTNTGLITLSSPAALLTGGAVSNNGGSIQGAGTVAAQILNNSGTVEAVGGTLTLTGPVTNSAGATLRTTTGTKLLMQGPSVFPANAGLIDLAGGTFDNSGHALDNTGTIAGYGVLAASTLTNDGAILFTGGTATINANITNSATKRIDIKFQPALFTGNINNFGTIKTWSTTVTYTGTLTNQPGSFYTSDPATNLFQANVISAGTMTGGPGDVFNFSSGSVNNSGTFSNGGTLVSSDNITNSGSFTQSGPQSWSPGSSFTNTAGLATFGSNAKLYGLTITGGTVDLTSSKLIVEDASTHAATLTRMKGYAGSGAFTSSVIPTGKTFVISDNAIAGLTSFGGFPADAGSILETVAYKGDFNLDGVVDLKDLQILALHWQQPVTDWSQADFDGNGIVALPDLQALATHWQDGVGSGGGSGESFSEALALIPQFGNTAPVPKPASLALFAVGGLLLTRRKRIH